MRASTGGTLQASLAIYQFGAGNVSKRPPLDEIRNILRSGETRTRKAKRIADEIRLAGDYHWAGIYQLEAEEIAILGWSGAGLPAHPRFLVTQGLCGAAVASRSAVVVGDVSTDARYLTTFGNTRSEMIVPVMGPAGTGVIGLVDIESDRPNAFMDDDRAMVERCAFSLLSLWDA
jgi:GAF domain-containing protein